MAGVAADLLETRYREVARLITNGADPLERIDVSYHKIIAIGPLTDIAATANAGVPLPPLFVMGGATQTTWQHSVPKVARAGARVSLQFRHST